MHPYEIRELNDEDLAKELEGTYRELLNLRFSLATKQLTNTSRLRTVRKDIARLNTAVRARQLQKR